MPKGVYPRNPGRRSRAQMAGNLPRNNFGRQNGPKRQASSSREQTQISDLGGDKNQGKWVKQLLDMGYGVIGEAPNRAVQSILCMIPNREIHEAILIQNRGLIPGAFSPVKHLGFSSWLEIFIKMDEQKMRVKECLNILEQVFNETTEVLADRTDLDDMLALEFKLGVTFLEKTHNIQDPTFEEEDNVLCNQTSVLVEEDAGHGFGKFIPMEDVELMKKEKEACLGEINRDTLMRLTLQNCVRFPIISEMAVEWLGEEFAHALWRSQNFSTLAPISVKAWRLMAGTTLFVKAHMGYPDIDRNYSYLHRIWRSFSPYFKCNCQAACSETITWLDQAIWFVFNHLELVYPKYSQGRMGSMLCFIQQNLKRPIMAQLAYMQVREMMVKITNKLAACPQCDLKQVFGDTKLVEACEVMIKDEEFAKKKFKRSREENTTPTITQRPSKGSDDFFPPRVARISSDSSSKNFISITDNSDAIVCCTPGEASVSKIDKPDNFKAANEIKKTRLIY